MVTELPPWAPPPGRVALPPYDGPDDVAEMKDAAASLARSRFCGRAHGYTAEDVFALMFIARGLNLALSLVWQNVFASRTGTGERSLLLEALARRAGHRLVLTHVSDDEAVYQVWREGADVGVLVAFTALEAQQLGLMEEWRDWQGNYRRQLANMLRNRALARAVKWHCGEVMIGAEWNDDGELLAPRSGRRPGLSADMAATVAQVQAAAGLGPHEQAAELRRIWEDNRLVLTSPAVIVDDGNGPQVAQTLEDLLIDRLGDARRAAADLPAPKPKRARTTKPKPKAEVAAGLPRPGRDAKAAATRQAAGTRMGCGCWTAEVMQTGQHGCGRTAR